MFIAITSIGIEIMIFIYYFILEIIEKYLNYRN